MSISDDYFSEILSPYTKPKILKVLSNEGDLCTYKVALNQNKKNNEFESEQNAPYLLISKQCFDHAKTCLFIQNFYQQHHFSHPAIMHLQQLSISPNNSFEAYYKYPENGKLSDYIGFAHENLLSESKQLDPTQKSIIAYGLAHALRYIHKHDYQFCEVNAKNIYLDEDFHPYLTNFYSIKKIDDKRVPKSKRLTKMHLKLDVYAYSIIYAALIEPVAFDPPANSAEEFFIKLSQKKRPVCKNATFQQRKVLDQMWDWIPRERPSFAEIIGFFENGDLIFEGTDQIEFGNYQNYLNEYQDAPLSPSYSTISSQPTPSTASIRNAANFVLNDEDDENNIEESQIQPQYFDMSDDIPVSVTVRSQNVNEFENDENNVEEEEEENETQNLNNDDEVDESTTKQYDDNDDDDDYLSHSKEKAKGSDDWELHDKDPSQSKGFGDWQPTEKENYFDGDDDDQPNQNDEEPELQQQKQKTELEQQQQLNTSTSDNNEKSKQKEETSEKKLNVIIARHDDKGFREMGDDSSSNHSYEYEGDENDAISLTQSVESEIKYLDVGGEVDVEAETTN